MGRRPLDAESWANCLCFYRNCAQNIKLLNRCQSKNVDELSECARIIPEQLDYFEEPLSNPEIYAELTDIPIALDESMQRDDHHALIAFLMSWRPSSSPLF